MIHLSHDKKTSIVLKFNNKKFMLDEVGFMENVYMERVYKWLRKKMKPPDFELYKRFIVSCVHGRKS